MCVQCLNTMILFCLYNVLIQWYIMFVQCLIQWYFLVLTMFNTLREYKCAHFETSNHTVDAYTEIWFTSTSLQLQMNIVNVFTRCTSRRYFARYIHDNLSKYLKSCVNQIVTYFNSIQYGFISKILKSQQHS